MWSEDKIIQYIKENLNERRFIHSIGVRDTAEKLAIHYGADAQKAIIAGLIHDCAKYMSSKKILSILEECQEPIDEVVSKTPAIMHGFASAYVAKNIMGVQDSEILDSVIYHTTGREKMTMLDKIIYLADYIEPGRNFPEVEDLRRESYIDLDNALLKSFSNTIKYVVDRGEMLHLNTIKARNYLLYKR